jgi:uncharacterized membrane protein
MANTKEQVQIRETQTVLYAGPLPVSQEFAQYEQVLPGTADRLLSITEKEVDHRHKNEDRFVRLNGRGQLFAFIIAVLSIGAVYLSILLKQPAVSIVPAIIALTSLAAVFLGKTRRK